MSLLALSDSFEYMLWVYAHYEYFSSCSAGIDFKRQNPTSIDGLRTERVKNDSYSGNILILLMFGGQ